MTNKHKAMLVAIAVLGVLSIVVNASAITIPTNGGDKLAITSSQDVQNLCGSDSCNKKADKSSCGKSECKKDENGNCKDKAECKDGGCCKDKAECKDKGSCDKNDAKKECKGECNKSNSTEKDKKTE